MIFLSLINLFSLSAWVIRTLNRSSSVSIISRILFQTEKGKGPLPINQTNPKVTSFVKKYLKCDGRFIVALLLDTRNPLLVYKIGKELLRSYRNVLEKTFFNSFSIHGIVSRIKLLIF